MMNINNNYIRKYEKVSRKRKGISNANRPPNLGADSKMWCGGKVRTTLAGEEEKCGFEETECLYQNPHEMKEEKWKMYAVITSRMCCYVLLTCVVRYYYVLLCVIICYYVLKSLYPTTFECFKVWSHHICVFIFT